MTLGPLVILLVLAWIAFQFWRLRGMAEFSIAYAKRYCEKHQLQFLSLARSSTRISAFRGKLDWKVVYQLEFSSNHEDAYMGTMTSFGNTVIEINLPVYKIDSELH
ncbi:DUF3301 domain-containing protein [Glaciecola sp. MH2013]|uniref:DUF3301 domain-containing protein n=1 Tax=Glaciecola sp. MH2013 TaxID=2785524 RepID=UPI00189F98A8|nr:DUF3301 domain-containing protein [Glaciecola sp. MH2013]MBF7072261.1 DUF3301 domain-containing protein [Glaciecola sp. MH2013]